MKKIYSLLFTAYSLLFIAYSVQAQVSADNNVVVSAQPGSTMTNSYVINNFNVPVGNNVALVIIARAGKDATITNINFNGSNYTTEQIGIANFHRSQCEIWAIPLGNVVTALNNQTITFTMSITNRAYGAIAATFTNVNQSTPANNFASSSNLSVDVLSNSGDMVIDGITSFAAAANYSVGAGQTILINNAVVSFSGGAILSGSYEAASGATVTMDWTNSGSGSGFIHIGANLQSNSVLPVEMTNFEVRQLQNYVELIWQTASELNNEKFEIEESQDGREFEKIGEVEGKGTTLEQQNYSFEVKNPRSGISYYRLKQIDFDGQYEYSKVISIDFKGEIGDVGEFYPNPSKSGLVNLDYTSQADDEIVVYVFDVTGKLVVNQVQQISNGDNNLSFDFSNLNTGIYIVKIDDERNLTHRKLIIER